MMPILYRHFHLRSPSYGIRQICPIVPYHVLAFECSYLSISTRVEETVGCLKVWRSPGITWKQMNLTTTSFFLKTFGMDINAVLLPIPLPIRLLLLLHRLLLRIMFLIRFLLGVSLICVNIPVGSGSNMWCWGFYCQCFDVILVLIIRR